MAFPVVNDYVHALRLQLEEAGAVGVSFQTLRSLSGDGAPDVEPQARQEAQGDTFECPVCFDSIQRRNGSKLGDCDDFLCRTCAVRYLEGITKLPVPCPTCREPLNPQLCLSVLAGTEAEAKFSRLVSEAHCEQLRYCANKQCNAPFDWVPDPAARGAPNEFCVYCPLCTEATCVKCRVLWHDNQTCEEYQNNNEDMNAVGDLARRNNWMPCPGCNALVEKRRGDCNHVVCRCGMEFCYNCGTPYLDSRPRLMNAHGRAGCSCDLFSNQNHNRNVQRRLPEAIANANRRQFGDGHGDGDGRRGGAQLGRGQRRRGNLNQDDERAGRDLAQARRGQPNGRGRPIGVNGGGANHEEIDEDEREDGRENRRAVHNVIERMEHEANMLAQFFNVSAEERNEQAALRAAERRQRRERRDEIRAAARRAQAIQHIREELDPAREARRRRRVQRAGAIAAIRMGEGIEARGARANRRRHQPEQALAERFRQLGEQARERNARLRLSREYGEPGPARMDFPAEMDDMDDADNRDDGDEDSRRHARVHLTENVLDNIRGATGEMLRNRICPYAACRRPFASIRDLENHLNNTNEHAVWICCNRPFIDLDAYTKHQRDASRHLH